MSELLPDSARGVFLQGQINQQLVDQITPRVIELQFQPGNKPITVFIDSPGGDPVLGMRLLELMRAPKAGSTTGHTLIACITGRAASAAADFAIQSNYSYIAPGAVMLCHGTSQGAAGSVNAQTAEYLANALRRTNERYARDLALAAFPRLLIRFFSTGGKELNDFINDPAKGLPGLVTLLQNRLLSDQLYDLTKRALGRQEAIRNLSAKVSAELARKKASPKRIDHEFAIIRTVLNEKLKTARATKSSLAHGGIDAVVADFQLLHDYYFGSLNHTTRNWVSQYGVMFLKPDEAQYYQSTTFNDDAAKAEWLMQTAGPRLRQLWYFSVSVARLLQEEDFEFGAHDAYWLGLVDEVIGENLPSLRLFMQSNQPSS
ncbi:MAG: ATP-dependent Clp protease proteolytic subunit [Verrucomicrobiaceae bacterium]|nr:ATP-dependent Clp protease proteolytic subunit [Verrucomicrobiaceae bacterium]